MNLFEESNQDLERRENWPIILIK